MIFSIAFFLLRISCSRGSLSAF